MEDNLNFSTMEYDLNFLKMEDDLNFFKMEDNRKAETYIRIGSAI